MATEADPSQVQIADSPDAMDDSVDLSIDKDRVRVLPGSTETAASFQIDGEDHTLGNALRYVIMKKYVCKF
jgi:DNA-directed RNA polymerase I and III subunit RPAC2